MKKQKRGELFLEILALHLGHLGRVGGVVPRHAKDLPGDDRGEDPHLGGLVKHRPSVEEAGGVPPPVPPQGGQGFLGDLAAGVRVFEELLAGGGGFGLGVRHRLHGGEVHEREGVGEIEVSDFLPGENADAALTAQAVGADAHGGRPPGGKKGVDASNLSKRALGGEAGNAFREGHRPPRRDARGSAALRRPLLSRAP